MPERRYGVIDSAELSADPNAHSLKTPGQYLLGGLAIFGVARSLPRLVREMPWLRRQLTEGLVWLAERAPVQDVSTYLRGIRLYTNQSVLWNPEARSRFGSRGAELARRAAEELDLMVHPPRTLLSLRPPLSDRRGRRFRAEGFRIGELRQYRRSMRTVREQLTERMLPELFISNMLRGYQTTMKAVTDRAPLGLPELQRQVFELFQGYISEQGNLIRSRSWLGDLVDLEPLTIREALALGPRSRQNPRGVLNQETIDRIRSFERSYAYFRGGAHGRRREEIEQAVNAFLDLPVDYRLFRTPEGRVVDFRGLTEAARQTGEVLTSEWHVPFVKLNPFNIFGIRQLRSFDARRWWAFPQSSRGPIAFFQRTGIDEQTTRQTLFTLGNTLYQVLPEGRMVAHEGYHIVPPGSQFAQHIRRFSDATAVAKGLDSDTFRLVTFESKYPGSAWQKTADTLRLFRQEEDVEQLDLLNIDTWFSSAWNRAMRRISPYRIVETDPGLARDVKQAGWADPLTKNHEVWEREVLIPASRVNPRGLATLNPDAWRQLYREVTAGAHDWENVTTVTMGVMTLLNKVNVALNQVGVGLPIESFASPAAFVKDLITRRVLPVMALYYGWRGVNEITHDAPARGAAGAVGVWQDIVASTSSFLGLTDRFQRLGELMPGIDQISEFPVFPLLNSEGIVSVLTVGDLLPVYLTPEELDYERRYGMTPIRRGRYWSLGNTPYTGGDVTGFAPHFSRIAGEARDFSYGPPAVVGSVPPWGPMVSDVSGIGPAISVLTIAQTGGAPGGALSGPFYARSGPMGSVRLLTGGGGYGYGGGGGSGYGGLGYGGGSGYGSGMSAELRWPIETIYDVPAEPEFQPLPHLAARTFVDRASDIFGFTGFAFRTAVQLERVQSTGPLSIGGITNTFYHSQIGGFGGTLSEVFRRFFPAQPVDQSGDMRYSGMPSWMPGDGDFINFQRGAYPYEKVAMGRYLLPGPEFAALWDLPEPDLSLEAGALSSPGAQQAWWTYRHPDRLGTATDLTTQVKADLESAGFQIHQGGRVVDEANQIWTQVPFFIMAPNEEGGTVPVPVFVAQPGESLGGPTTLRAQFAAARLGVDRALVFAAMGDGTLVPTAVSPDLTRLNQLLETARVNREWTREQIRRGNVNGMEYYHPAYRLLTLAAVAPYSDEYRYTSKLVSSMKLTEEQERIVRQAREMASLNKNPMRTYDYKFRNQPLRTIEGEVEGVVDKDTILISGIANRINLAGVHVLPGEEGEEAEAYLRSVLRPGARVRIQIGENEAWKLGDADQSLRAIVYADGRSLNEILMQQGWAEEDVDDDSAAGVRVRYSPAQRAFGAAWEAFAHLRTPFHTKFLNVQSPAERYLDREIYGLSFQSWEHPFGDYLVPTIQSFARLGPLLGTAAGALLGYQFGETPLGRMVFTGIGALVSGLTASYVFGYNLTHEHDWVPERRERQWELEVYMDALKYVKALRNYSYYAELAEEEEGFDVAAFLREQEARGDRNRYAKALLEAKKRRIQAMPPDADAQALAAELRIPGEYTSREELLHAVNQMLGSISEDRETVGLGPYALQALAWYQEAKQTMQGWQPGDSIQDLIQALPDTDRRYFSRLLEAAPREYEALMRAAPPYLRRALQLARGEEPTDELPSLSEIFHEHGLPDPNWEGWRPEVSLGDVRIKIVRREGLDTHAMGIYPQEIKEAERSGITNIPRVFDYRGHLGARQVEQRLRDILGSNAVEHDIEIVYGGSGLRIEVDHEQDRRAEVSALIRTSHLL